MTAALVILAITFVFCIVAAPDRRLTEAEIGNKFRRH